MKVLFAQSCLTLCDPMNHSPPGSSVHGILHVRILSRLPFPRPGNLLDPGIEPRSPALQADALTSEPPGNSTITYRESTNNEDPLCVSVCLSWIET